MLLSLFFVSTVVGQTKKIVDKNHNDLTELSGKIFDSDKNTPLLYATIYISKNNRGTISNELGDYSINVSSLSNTDTISFQFIGYKTITKTLGELTIDSDVYLKEDIISLNEMVVFATEPDAKDVVKNVVKNIESNYNRTTSKKEVFIRVRDNSFIDEFTIDLKKSSFAELNKKTIDQASENMPKYTTSYTDFLCYLYLNKKEENAFKVDPIKMVSLKEKKVTELDHVAKVLEKALNNTKTDEYWKVKTGIFSVKIDQDEIGSAESADSLNDNSRNLSFYTSSVKQQLDFSKMEDKDKWEFLYSTRKYEYTLSGGVSINGEYVYVIDFTPKKKGLYEGRLYISTDTYALIRADFEYAPGKTGTDFSFMGIGYIEKNFKGSIYFEKKDDNYELKYCSQKLGTYFTIDRNFSLLKKKNRFLIDKKMEEIKVGFIMKANVEESSELLILDDKKISDQQYTDFNQPKYFEPIFVKQFNDNLWKDYDIIEPTEQMKDYKKQGDY